MSPNLKQKIIKDSLTIDDIVIPVDVYKEMRMDVRFALRADKIILRLPIFCSKKDIKTNIDKAESWVKALIIKNPSIRDRFKIREYKNGNSLSINGKEFIFDISRTSNINYSAKIRSNRILIFLPHDSTPSENKKAIVALQSRLMAQFFLPEVTARIQEINNKYFNIKISGIKLKYNKSNWGSRSAMGNINISTRLLFAPRDVQDYVFVHELAHFIEMNHSSRFWDIVRKIVPDYKEKEKWLKIHGPSCDF